MFAKNPVSVLRLTLYGVPHTHPQRRFPYTSNLTEDQRQIFATFGNKGEDGHSTFAAPVELTVACGKFFVPGAPVPSVKIYKDWSAPRTAFIMDVVVHLEHTGDQFLTVAGWIDKDFGPMPKIDINSEDFREMVFNVNSVLEYQRAGSRTNEWTVKGAYHIFADREGRVGARLDPNAPVMLRPVDIFTHLDRVELRETGTDNILDTRVRLSPSRPIRTVRENVIPTRHMTKTYSAWQSAWQGAGDGSGLGSVLSNARGAANDPPSTGPFEKLIQIGRGDWHTASFSADTLASMGSNLWEEAEISYQAQFDDTALGQASSTWKDDCVAARMGATAIQTVSALAMQNAIVTAEIIIEPGMVKTEHLGIYDAAAMTHAVGGFDGQTLRAFFSNDLQTEIEPALRLEALEIQKVFIKLNLYGLSTVAVTTHYGTNTYQYASYADALMNPLLTTSESEADLFAKDYHAVLEALDGVETM